MFWIGKHKWIGVFIARNTNNFSIVNNRGEDKVQYYSTREGFPENQLGINNPRISLDPHIKQKLDILGTKWEIRLTGSTPNTNKVIIELGRERPSSKDIARLHQKVLDVLRPGIFVPRKNFIEVDSALTSIYGSAEPTPSIPS